MSRKSENSRAGSAGDAESVFSSYDSSPRKPTDCSSRGPFGDHSVVTKPSSYVIYKIQADNSSTNSEDDECSDLKREYLQKLKQIREKLATIDIANKSYYNNCFGYPPQPFSHCVITEITDEDLENIDATKNNIKTPRPDHFEYTPDGRKKEKKCIKGRQLYKDEHVEQNTNTASLRSTSSINLMLNENNEALPEEPLKTKDSKAELKTILNYGRFCSTESSTTELLDLNYNPPKKRPCIRETTPKMVLSEGSMPLPYHISIGLHHDISNVNKKSPELVKQTEGKGNRCIGSDSGSNMEKNYHHIFPEVQVECSSGKNQTRVSSSASSKVALHGNERSSQKSPEKDNMYVLFLDTQEQSSSGSPKSNKTIVTETTITGETPPHQPKRRRIFLRSASNKIKPIDKVSLWEEIRTMDAVNKKKRQESSSSKDSYFQRIIHNKTEPETEIDLKAVGSLDVPPKVSSTPRFPSVTKLTKLCSSVFKKKSSSNCTENLDTRNSAQITRREPLEVVPTVANALLNFKREQDICLENDEHTPSIEEYSDYAEVDDDIDAYYQPHCLFCFCF